MRFFNRGTRGLRCSLNGHRPLVCVRPVCFEFVGGIRAVSLDEDPGKGFPLPLEAHPGHARPRGQLVGSYATALGGGGFCWGTMFWHPSVQDSALLIDLRVTGNREQSSVTRVLLQRPWASRHWVWRDKTWCSDSPRWWPIPGSAKPGAIADLVQLHGPVLARNLGPISAYYEEVGCTTGQGLPPHPPGHNRRPSEGTFQTAAPLPGRANDRKPGRLCGRWVAAPGRQRLPLPTMGGGHQNPAFMQQRVRWARSGRWIGRTDYRKGSPFVGFSPGTSWSTFTVWWRGPYHRIARTKLLPFRSGSGSGGAGPPG